MDEDHDLILCYRQTLFKVAAPGAPFDIRVDQPSPEADALLKRHGKTTWAYITAWNPHSKPLPDAENFRRQAQLETETSVQGYAIYPGEGVGNDPPWREASLLIIGIVEQRAVALGTQFGQSAIVVGSFGTPARLVFCGV
jgi:hypothetical protein